MRHIKHKKHWVKHFPFSPNWSLSLQHFWMQIYTFLIYMSDIDLQFSKFHNTKWADSVKLRCTAWSIKTKDHLLLYTSILMNNFSSLWLQNRLIQSFVLRCQSSDFMHLMHLFTIVLIQLTINYYYYSLSFSTSYCCCIFCCFYK